MHEETRRSSTKNNIMIKNTEPKDYLKKIQKEFVRSIISSDRIERNNLDFEARIGNKPQALNTYRLKPCSKRVRNTRFVITDSGTVRLEKFKSRNSENLLSEAVEISQNGMQITYVQSRELPRQNADHLESQYSVTRKTFTLEDLPQKLCIYYNNANKFVELVKASTPKIIVYTRSMKCTLMENSANPFFIANFGNGQTYLRRGEDIKLLDVQSEKVIPLSTDKSHMNQNSQHTNTLICKASKRYNILMKLCKEVSSNQMMAFPLVLGSQAF